MRRFTIPALVACAAMLGAGAQYLPPISVAAATSDAACSTEFAGGIAPRISSETIAPLCFHH